MKDKTTKNFAFISPEGFIEVKVSEIAKETDAIDIGKQVINLLIQVEDTGKPVKILIDSTDEKSWPKEVMPVLISIFTDIKFKKGAIFGSAGDLEEMQKAVVNSAKIPEDKGQFFKTRAEAVAWLSQD